MPTDEERRMALVLGVPLPPEDTKKPEPPARKAVTPEEQYKLAVEMGIAVPEPIKEKETRVTQQYTSEMPLPDLTVTAASIERAKNLVKKIQEDRQDGSIKKLDKSIVPLTIMDYPTTTGKATSLIPNDRKFYMAAGYGLKETEEMKRFGKGFIPGWLTVEDWKTMKPYERAASIAGDIGASILIVLGAYGTIKGIVSRRAVPNLKGTIAKDYPGLKYYTNDDLQQAINNMKIAGKQKATLLKNTVPIDEPVNVPFDVTVVKESPVGVEFLKGTQEVNIKPPKTYTTGGAKKGGLPVKGGGGSAVKPTTSTMTIDQFLKQLGVSNYEIGMPKVIPLPISIPKRKEETEIQTPLPAQITQPAKTQQATQGREIQTRGTGKGQEIQTMQIDYPVEQQTPQPTPQPQPEPQPEPRPQPQQILEPVPTVTVKATTIRPPEKKRDIKIPLVPILPVGVSDDDIKRIKKNKLPVVWKQGFGWWVIEYPYKSAKDMHFERKKPQGAFEVKGVGSAYRTLQALGGNPNILITRDLGIVDVTVTGTKLTFKRKPVKKIKKAKATEIIKRR